MDLFRTEGLVKRFGAFTAIDDLSLTVREGELRAIIGPNGAGKTTLFNLLTGGLRATAGRIFLRDEEITHLPPHAIARRGVARTFQVVNVFNGLPVWENVRVAAQARFGDAFGVLRTPAYMRKVNERTERALARVGLARMVRQQAGLLSHGDQKRLELAMVIATEPEVILLDEPLAGMAPDEAAAAVDLISDIARDHTVVLVEHDMSAVFRVADSISVLENGALLAEGTPDQIRNDERVQAVYLGVKD